MDTVELIFVWPDGDWCWAFDWVQCGYEQWKSDDYDAVEVPNTATRSDIDEFVEVYINSDNSDNSNQNLSDYWN